MKKRFFTAVAVLSAAIALSGTALAEEYPTDEYGNEITWDVNGAGYEDGAGLEELDEDETTEAETYSFQEQAEVFSQMQAAETEAPEETGLLTVVLDDVPDSWSQNNIRLSLYRGNVKEDIFLYRQSNWGESIQIPVGHYTVFKVETLDGKEEFHSDISTFDITEKTAVNLTLAYGAQEATAPEVTIPDAENTENTEEIDSDMQVTTKQQTMAFLISIVVAAVFILSGLCWIGKRRKRTSDLLDGLSNLD